MRNNNSIHFDKPFLDGLVADENSCVQTQEQNYHLALHPFHLNNIKESLKGILNKGIARYDKVLQGILLGYHNIKLLSHSCAVINDSFFIHVDIAATFYLFRPEVGKILTGTVNKKSDDHVGCLVHQVFNVSLPRPDEVNNQEWMGAKAQIGQDILFCITFMNLQARLPYIKAEAILTDDSGISTGEENAETINKRVLFDDGEYEELKVEQKENEAEVELGYVENKAKKKKSKKDKQKDNIVPASKRKQSKHEKNVTDLKKIEKTGRSSLPEDEMYQFEGPNFDERKSKKYKRKLIKKIVQDEIAVEHINGTAETSSKKNLNKDSLKKSKRKSKSDNSLDDLREAALKSVLHDLSKQEKMLVKKGKSQPNKKATMDLDVSLPEINLGSLFKESSGNQTNMTDGFEMADNDDKATKKRRSSMAYTSFWENKPELPLDSDLERIYQDVDKISSKRKNKVRDVAEEVKQEKWKRHYSNSSDEFESPQLKKKIKKEL